MQESVKSNIEADIASHGDDIENYSSNLKHTGFNHDLSSDLDSFSDDDSSTNNQLFQIEKKIQQPDLSKRERRLL